MSKDGGNKNYYIYKIIVELHENPSCGGNSVELRSGYPYLQDVWWWGLHRRGMPDHAVYAE